LATPAVEDGKFADDDEAEPNPNDSNTFEADTKEQIVEPTIVDEKNADITPPEEAPIAVVNSSLANEEAKATQDANSETSGTETAEEKDAQQANSNFEPLYPSDVTDPIILEQMHFWDNHTLPLGHTLNETKNVTETLHDAPEADKNENETPSIKPDEPETKPDQGPLVNETVVVPETPLAETVSKTEETSHTTATPHPDVTEATSLTEEVNLNLNETEVDHMENATAEVKIEHENAVYVGPAANETVMRNETIERFQLENNRTGSMVNITKTETDSIRLVTSGAAVVSVALFVQIVAAVMATA
jgi:hypothetical protein